MLHKKNLASNIYTVDHNRSPRRQKEPVNVALPDKILTKMRLNKNFANVYTPFHEFDEFEPSVDERK